MGEVLCFIPTLRKKGKREEERSGREEGREERGGKEEAMGQVGLRHCNILFLQGEFKGHKSSGPHFGGAPPLATPLLTDSKEVITWCP